MYLRTLKTAKKNRHICRKLTTATDKLVLGNDEKDDFHAQVADLQKTLPNGQNRTSTLFEKKENLATVKRWYTLLRNEMNESTGEKKRLPDMLEEVSTNLKRANHELNLL